MYKLFDYNGNFVGDFENIRYIKFSKAGCFVQSDIDEAVGVVAGNNIYTLAGTEDERMNDYTCVDVVNVDSTTNSESITVYNKILSEIITDGAEIAELVNKYYPVCWNKIQVLNLVKIWIFACWYGYRHQYFFRRRYGKIS